MSVSVSLLTSDLQKSGLRPEDINAYVAQESELAAIGVKPHMMLAAPGQESMSPESPGYVIPYYDLGGRRVAHYRVRLFKTAPKGPKYLQPAGSPNHIYFPPGFSTVLEQTKRNKSLSCINGFKPAVLICEGEKKAASAVKAGFLCVGVGGVYSWRTKNILLPENVRLEKDTRTGRIRVKMPSGSAEVEEESLEAFSMLAIGFNEVVELVRRMDWQFLIAFDSDYPANQDVQKAAAALGFELRSKGLSTPQIRQLVLPGKEGQKIGLDDFLVAEGTSSLQEVMHHTMEAKCAFPRHPNMQEHLASKLNGNLKRAQAREIALGLVADLDSRGTRMKEANTGSPYFFDVESKKLMQVHLLHNGGEPLHETSFGQYTYRTYGLTQGDTKLLPWLAATFTGEQPIESVEPQSVLTVNKNSIYLQINDGEMVRITGKDIKVLDNGSDNILFKSDQVEDTDSRQLLSAVAKFESMKELPNLWLEVASGFKFARSTDPLLVSLLFCMSPWLLRWRGTQLPIELMIGEPGSGKSSMYALRLSILTGRPVLRNQPTDIRDWYSSITSQGGLHVIDNVHFASKEIRQRMSDEMCRIVTEPAPFVEMRRLYSTADILRIPANTTFALTAIQQPFVNADIMQRSVIFELAAVGTNHDGNWVEHQLDKLKGRINWLAYHLVVLRRFLALVQEEWNPRYKSGHRLANFEQALMLMGKVFGINDIEGMKSDLIRSVEEAVSEYDWSMEGLKEFAVEMKMAYRNKHFTCADIAAWALGKEDFLENSILTNARRLSRYIKSHANMVARSVGIVESGASGNRVTYRFK